MAELPGAQSGDVLMRTRKRAEIPIYSFEQHQRQKETVPIYSPHIVILEGILALQDQRVLDMLDLKIFVEADADVCLSRRSKSGSL
jgi:uridine kinase